MAEAARCECLGEACLYSRNHSENTSCVSYSAVCVCASLYRCERLPAHGAGHGGHLLGKGNGGHGEWPQKDCYNCYDCCNCCDQQHSEMSLCSCMGCCMVSINQRQHHSTAALRFGSVPRENKHAASVLPAQGAVRQCARALIDCTSGCVLQASELLVVCRSSPTSLWR